MRHSWRHSMGVLATGLTALAAVGCTSAAPDADLPQDTITYAYTTGFTSYNSDRQGNDLVANSQVIAQVVRGFSHFDEHANLVPDTEFGTFHKISDAPLRVEYTISDKAIWSDGEPIDCDDVVFTWLLSQPAATPDGGFEGGFETTDTRGFEIMKKPECADGDKTFVTEYKEAYSEWALTMGGFFPAHMVERKSGVVDVISAADDVTGPQIRKLAKVYNSGFEGKPGKFPADMWLSSGPFVIADWRSDGSVVLERNPRWWGKPARAARIVFRLMDADQILPAVVRGEVDVAELDPQPEVVQQLRDAGDQVRHQMADSYAYDNLEFNHGKGVMQDLRLRQAFALCTPRQQIVDELVRPVNPKAAILDARLTFPFQKDYAVVSGGGKPYDVVDLAAAQALVKQTGLPMPVDVELGWNKPSEGVNQYRQTQVDMIRESCGKAGFRVVDSGQPDFFEVAEVNGDYDVALFTWLMSPSLLSPIPIFTSGGAQNTTGYASPEVDRLFAELAAGLDTRRTTDLLRQLEDQLWADVATLPIVSQPSLVVYGPTVTGVVHKPSMPGITWNCHEWARNPSGSTP